MDTDMTPNEQDRQESLHLASETLAEVREATRDSDQRDLYEFASLLSQVVDLCNAIEADHEIEEFIRDGLHEIQSVVAGEEAYSDRLESLRGEAIDRWGEVLSPLDDDEMIDDVQDAGSWDADAGDDLLSDEHDDVVAPSAAEISSLLGQLGHSADDESVDGQMNEQSVTETQREEPTSNCDVEQASAQDHSEHGVTPDAEIQRNEPGPDHEPLPNMDANDGGTSVASLDPELREAFLDDASNCISSIEASLLKLEDNANDSDALNQICRELHTLKGASASVGLAEMAGQLHELEDQLRDDHAAGRAPEVDSLLKSIDSIRSEISPASTTEHVSDGEANDIGTPIAVRSVPSLADFNDGQSDDEMVRVKSSQLNRLMDMLAELVMLRNRRETELADLQEVYHELIGSVSKMRLLSSEGNVVSDACSSLQLAEVANDVMEVAQHVRDCARPVAEGNTAVSQFIRQFRQELVALRRTPVSGLFRRLQRVVRDAANAESKQVRLKLIGEDAGIERSLQQRLYEPLLHIVRNSVCHGIEAPEDREKSGKKASGTITLEAKSGPDLFVIEIRDDGRGLDYDAIRRRGVDAGLIASDQVASREELAQLIFHPGFSTRQTTSQVAGRGVGMDVVSTTIQRMRGWLEVDSEAQKGTRIRLSFPLPSVIQHAMVFRTAGQLFALPMQSVRSAGESESKGLLLSFSEILGCPAAESSQHIVLAGESTGGAEGNAKQQRVTLLVDEVVGPEEVVVRPLPTLLKQHQFCAGATLSGMGQTVLFLDARRLVESQQSLLGRFNAPAKSEAATQTETKPSTPARSSRPHVLVVDDSISARKRVVRSLRRYAVDIVEAIDGKQAIEILKRQHFDAVFSDMEMPHATGMDLLAEVNAGDRKDPPPVVIISSRNEDEFTSRAKELGANNYLIKPLADEALDGVIAGIPALCHLETEATNPLQMSGETHDR